MELYLDSADIQEVEKGARLGFLAGLTTTPTFMHRGGVTNVDDLIVQLSKMVPVLQIEALGDTAEECVQEAERLLSLGLDKSRTVFKIPASMEAMRACRMLRDRDIQVNIHLVYSLQQAYMAASAGASYICVLVGRMQDQGYNALDLVGQSVEMVDRYAYPSRIMFSSVRHPQHVREALELGCHTCTIPYKVMQQLTENNFTALGTEQFVTHTRLMTMRVGQVARETPAVTAGSTILEALVAMTASGLGAVPVVDQAGELLGYFTDGDLRRHLKEEGKSFLEQAIDGSHLNRSPLTLSPDAPLSDATRLIKERHVDNLLVVEGTRPVGILDVQDLIKLDVL